MILKTLLILAAVVAVILVVAAFQPSTFRVTRRTVIAAPPAAVFARVNDLPKWQAWSPWEKMDPAMKRRYEGPAAGVGAVYAWDGNKEVGSGRMTIIESRPADLVRMKLEFFQPMAGVCTAEFTFKAEGPNTAVQWSMDGTNNYAAKIFCLFMNMDKMVGGQFEQGLANLKRLAETGAK
jgi:hypothetical protein